MPDLTPSEFVSKSLELDLFFLRIMREHGFFIAADLPCKNTDLISQAKQFKDSFTKLLAETIGLANNHVSVLVLNSGEVVTDDTLPAEEKSSALLGIPLDTAVTKAEMNLTSGKGDAALADTVSDLNSRAIDLTNELIDFKSMLLKDLQNCTIAMHMFSDELEHLRDEAQHFVSDLTQLQKRELPSKKQQVIDEKYFWDPKMKDHGLFIAHYLDPSEASRIVTARKYASTFRNLQEAADAAKKKGITNSKLRTLVNKEINATRNFSNFKDRLADAALACKLKSVLPPLWYDHVMREANHFLRELKEY